METKDAKYAVVGRWTMDPSRADEQDRELRDVIVPLVQSYPGFVTGYWTRDPESGRTHTVIVLESRQAACDFKDMVESRQQHRAEFGVVNDFLVITDVIASAHS
jgi:hypothetical protein